eukprot:5879749-Alexandrium_andersonii.AAC.1
MGEADARLSPPLLARDVITAAQHRALPLIATFRRSAPNRQARPLHRVWDERGASVDPDWVTRGTHLCLR